MNMNSTLEVARSLTGKTIEKVQFTDFYVPYVDIAVWDIILTLSDGSMVAFTSNSTSLQTVKNIELSDLDGMVIDPNNPNGDTLIFIDDYDPPA